MTQSEEFISSGRANQVCKLMRSIYGSKQVSRSWNIRFDMTVKEFGFIKNMDKPCVYKKTSGSVIIFLVLYVGDILLIGNDISMMQSVKTWPSNKFFIKDQGEASYILGIKIYRDKSKRMLGLSQSRYIDLILKRFNMEASKKGYLFVSYGIHLSKKICLKDTRREEKDE